MGGRDHLASTGYTAEPGIDGVALSALQSARKFFCWHTARRALRAPRGSANNAGRLCMVGYLVLSTLCAALSPQPGWAPRDTTQQSKSPLDGAVLDAPCVVLVRPHLDVNIGAVARAMANFGLADLRLVAPFPGDQNMERCDWRSEAAVQRACGAGEILEQAQAFDSLPEALGDVHRAYATSARLRGLNTKCISSPDAARDIARLATNVPRRCALLFGAESSGLSNDELELADYLVQVPAADAFSSLNLAMAVTVVGSDVFRAFASQSAADAADAADAGDADADADADAAAGADADADADSAEVAEMAQGAVLVLHNDEPSTKAQQVMLADRYEVALEAAGFKDVRKYKRLRRFLTRAAPTYNEVGTLHGVLSALTRGKE